MTTIELEEQEIKSTGDTYPVLPIGVWLVQVVDGVEHSVPLAVKHVYTDNGVLNFDVVKMEDTQ